MNRAVLGAAVAVGVSVVALVLPSAAASADETGFDSVACAEASVRVQTTAEAAVRAGDNLAKANEVILSALQANLAAAEQEQAAKLAAFQAVLDNDDSTADAIKTAREALTAAQLKVQEAAKALADAAPPSALKDKLTAAQADLKVAIERRVKACDFVLPPVTTTVVPPPSVTVTVTPPPPVRLPSSVDTGYAP